ncbi:MAG: glutamate-1-semialdehyde 2,1-aminomutase [Sedimentisphaerales bacterium]|nr:glutamate-1-semialdehyde 2,1-aminomutase [Sedimentisphaerales bacterium]
MRTQKNERSFKDAVKVMPGGVNSPVRAFKAVGAAPIFIDKAKDAYLYDVDGNRYIDYCMSWGPMILGHANKAVLDEVKKTMAKGTSYGVPTTIETDLAKVITGAIESVQKVRFVSSGTEAVMTAIRLARAATGKDKIIKFVGGYHGHVDHMLVSAGSGALTLGMPSSPGVPKDFTKHTLLARYNDLDSVKNIFKKYSGKIAAVIIEPVAGNMGVIPAKKDFLKGLRVLCTKNKSILIFDEVITGFRLGFGSIQKKVGVKADLTCLGKIIGGGFPIGAVGGRASIMNNLSPQGPVYQAGTLSGNPVCVAAGLATLKILKVQKPYTALERRTKHLCAQITQTLNKAGVEHTINQVGSMFTLFFTAGPVTDYDSALKSDTKKFAKYFKHMLNAGIYLPPSQFEANFLSTKHTDAHIKRTIEVLKKIKL